mmetsp:Transcript_17230/g.23309  ORF Transcript_17230/g.23309 Transcript_17230/m.23309 type:complete len:92 (+) Transcript_17230:138-413(+)
MCMCRGGEEINFFNAVLSRVGSEGSMYKAHAQLFALTGVGYRRSLKFVAFSGNIWPPHLECAGCIVRLALQFSASSPGSSTVIKLSVALVE